MSPEFPYNVINKASASGDGSWSPPTFIEEKSHDQEDSLRKQHGLNCRYGKDFFFEIGVNMCLDLQGNTRIHNLCLIFLTIFLGIIHLVRTLSFPKN